MNRNGIILTVLSAVVTCVYNVGSLGGTGNEATGARSTPPVIEATPTINYARPDKGSISKIEVWNLKRFEGNGIGNLPSLKEMFKPYYSISKAGRFEAISRGAGQNDRWEFQGVLVSGGAYRAVFYNPAQQGKKIKILARGEEVDSGLVVRKIGRNFVTLRTTKEKKPQDFELKLFNSNRENYDYKHEAHQ